MASSSQPHISGLKYLGFVELFAEKATKHVANVYAFAKESTGPLKYSVDGVETTVKIIAGPVYEKLDGKPHEILLFVDKKVDNVVDSAFVHNVKEKSANAYDIACQVPEIFKYCVDELQHADIKKAAKMCYTTYEPMAQEWSYAAWLKFLKLPYASHAVHYGAPPALFCARNFNHAMGHLKEMQVPLADFIPCIPVDRLEKIFKEHVG